MENLYEYFFNVDTQGKPYQSEDEYLKEVYSFLDMCITVICMHTIPETEGESILTVKKWHIPGIAVNLNEALAALGHNDMEQKALEKQAEERQALLKADFHIKSRILFTENKGILFATRRMMKEFRLSDLECFLFFLSMACSYDTKYEILFAHLQGDMSYRHPTIRLAIALYELYQDTKKEELGKIIQQKGSLFEYLLVVKESKGNSPLMQSFTLCKRVYSYLFQNEAIAPELEGFVELSDDGKKLEDVYIRHDYLEKINQNMKFHLSQNKELGNVLNLYGDVGNGKRFFVKHAARENGFHVLFVDITKILDAKANEIDSMIKMLFLECVLTRSVLCFIDLEERDDSGEEEKRQVIFPFVLKYLLSILPKKMRFWFWLSKEKAQYLLDYPLHVMSMELPILSVSERILLWNKFSEGYKLHKSIDLLLCANQYVLTIRGIQEVLKVAELNHIIREEAYIQKEDILAAVKQQSPNQLGRYATLINAVYTWEDLVVAPEQKRQMEMICNQLKYRNVVGEEWGFHKKTAYGRGICAMFYGAPGTGKTMAVQVMANELGLDLYRIDLSQLVSKYIGETEKNISTLFKKAKNTNALLFFDEADSLFAKRSEVKDSHDRNANAETAHLLQKLEDYEGITILATNYVNNIDDAFKRRIKFMVNFSFPTPDVRYQLWTTILPKSVPCEEELDFEFYAEHFELSGSSIKEILTNAAYIAASENSHLANRHLIEAIKLNFSKYGKVLTKEDFGYLI